MSKVNFDILLTEAIDNLYEETKARLGKEDGKIPFGISRDWSKAQPSLRVVGVVMLCCVVSMWNGVMVVC